MRTQNPGRCGRERQLPAASTRTRRGADISVSWEDIPTDLPCCQPRSDARALRRDALLRTRAARRPRGHGRDLKFASASTCPSPAPSSDAHFFPCVAGCSIFAAAAGRSSAAAFWWPEHHPRCEHTPGPCTALTRPTSHTLCALNTSSSASHFCAGSCSTPPPPPALPSPAAACQTADRMLARRVRRVYWCPSPPSERASALALLLRMAREAAALEDRVSMQHA